MSNIKTKVNVTDIKTLDKRAMISKSMKDAYVRTKDKAEETQQTTHDSPHAYATDKASEIAKEIAANTAYKAERFGRNSSKKVYNDIKAIRKTRKVEKVADNTIKKVYKGTIKTTQKSIKTAERTSKATIKTSQKAAKATAKTVQSTLKTSQKAAQTAKVVAKATAEAAKVTVKAIIATVKATIAVVKGTIALIAAGGWVAIVVVLIICMLALILSSPFGIFSGGGVNQTPTIQEVVSTINDEWNAKINQIKTYAGEVDEIIIKSNNEIVTSTNSTNWADVLSVFSVLLYSGDNPTYVIEMDANKISKLKEIFNNMNTVSSQTELVEKNDITITRLIIEIKSKSYQDMLPVYNFNTEQQALLNELMSDKNRVMVDAIIN